MNTKGIYIRSGSTKRRASDEEVRNMIFRSARKPFDLEKSPSQDLSFINFINKFTEEDIKFDLNGLRLIDSKSSCLKNKIYFLFLLLI